MSEYRFKNNTNNFKRPTDDSIKLDKQKSKAIFQQILNKELPSCLQQINEQDDQNQIVNYNQNKFFKNYQSQLSSKKQPFSKQKKIVSSKNYNKQKLNQNKPNSNTYISHKFSIIKVLQSQDPANSYRYKNIQNYPKKSSLQEIKKKIAELIQKSQQQNSINNTQSKNARIHLYPKNFQTKLSVTDQFMLSGYIKIYLKQIKLVLGQKTYIQDQLLGLKASWQLYQLKLKMCPDIWQKKDKQIFEQLKVLNQYIDQVEIKETNIRNIIKRFNTIIIP